MKINQDQFDAIVKMAPQGTTPDGLKTALEEQGHTVEQPKSSTFGDALGAVKDGVMKASSAVASGGMSLLSDQYTLPTFKKNVVDPLVREFVRPGVSVAQGILGSDEAISTPVGEVKPYASLTPGEAAGGAFETGTAAIGLRVPGPSVVKAAPGVLQPFIRASEGAMGAADNALSATGKRIGPKLQGWAERVYGSVLKASDKLADKGVVQTGLTKGIRITEGGAQKVETMIDSIDGEISKLIDAGKAAGSEIDIYKILDHVEEVKKWYQYQPGGEDIVKGIDDFVLRELGSREKEFGRYIPVEYAQKLKQGAQQAAKEAYGALSKNWEIQTKKALGSAYRLEIADAVPGINDLNKQYGPLLEFQKSLDKAVFRLSKHNLISLQDALTVGTEFAVRGANKIPVVSVIMKIATSPGAKSQLAISVNKLGKAAAKSIIAGDTAFPYAALKIIDLIKGTEGKIEAP